MSNWKEIEETMERTGSDDIYGWSFRRALRKVGRGISRGARGAARGIARGARGVASLPRSAWKTVSSFIPGRDRGKAAIVKRLNAKLIRERANFLQIKDLRAGVQRPRAAYVQRAKPWSRAQIKRVGLPTKLAGNGSETASAILGDDVVGDWWNPLSWFSEKEEEATANTEQERAPDEQVQQVQQEAAAAPPVEEPVPEESAGDWGTFSKTFTDAKKAGESAFLAKPADDSEGAFVGSAFVGKLYRSIKDPLADMDGDGLVVDASGDIVRESELAGAFVGTDDNLFGAAEEKAIEASGDADIGRRFQRSKRGGGDPLGRLGRFHAIAQAMKRHHHHHHHNPLAHALKLRIKAQLAATKVVSKGLVMKWATAKAGTDSGERRRHFFRKMKMAINARGGTISRDKSETAGCRR
jgi:hypothetical protein